jgi:hypothetical protein
MLLQRLTDARDIAVPENSKHPRKELELLAITVDILILQELDNGLGGRQS